MASVAEAENYFAGAVSRGVGDTLPHPIGNQLSAMVRSYELEYDTTGAITCALLLEYANIPHIQITPQQGAPATPSVTTTDAAGNAAETDNAVNVTQPDRRSFLQQFQQIGNAARAWMRDLVACQQIAALTVDNVNNYFMSQNGTRVHGGSILRIINVAKNAFPRLIELPAVRNSLSRTQFLVYHCTYSSTPGLVRRFIEDTQGFTIIDPASLTAVNDALAEYWDMDRSNAIPQRLTAMARAYLEAVNSLPPNWYQGNKARAAVSPMLYNRWFNTFKVYARIVQNLGDTDAIADMAALTARAGAANLMA